MQNEAQYDLDSKAAKMSALSSKNLDKYEYLISPIFMINITGFFKYIADKEKDSIDYEILSSKVDDINFYDRYNTLYNYLNYCFKFSAEEISIKNKSFLEDLSKGFKL